MKKEPGFYHVVRIVLTPLIKLFFGVKYINKDVIPLQGRCIVAGNHRSFFDALLLGASTKRVLHSMLWYTYYNTAPWFFKATGTISVGENGNKALHQAIDMLNQDKAVNIEPEGAINRTKEILLPFKPGVAIMAKRTNSPIVLFAITGDIKLFSKNLKVSFSEPFYVNDKSVEEATEYIRNKLIDLIMQNNN